MSARPPKPLRIACDMDGVLADLGSALSRHSAALFGESDGAASHALSMSRRRQLWDRVRATENFWETLEETTPGRVARLATIVAERRWEMIFLTTRPETAGASVQVQTQRWLMTRGFFSPSVFVVRRSRAAIAAALELDVVVDDRPDSCLDVTTDSSARAALMWRRADDPPLIVTNRSRIDLVKDVDELIDLLAAIDSRRHEAPPRVSRLRQLFGA